MSSTSLNGLDTDIKTNDSSGDSVSDIGSTEESAIESESDSKSTVDSSIESESDSSSTIDSTIDSIVIDEKTYDTDENTKIVEDTTYESSDLEKASDNNYDSSGNLILVDNKASDLTDYPIIETDKVYYAPNERVVPAEEIISITENELGDISSGIEKEVKIEYFKEVESVKLTPVKNLKEVKVTIIKLKDKPEEIVDTPIDNTSIYTYLDIKLISDEDYIEEKDIQTLEFKFKVEKEWINSNKIDKSTVKLIRYHDGEWQNLSTTLDNENETCIYYIAESPGCSTFAVVGKKVVEKDEAYGSELTIPWSIIFAFIILLTLILVIIIIKARYIYLKDD
jgi:PGF-pre-PGF domain-containing protein